MQTLLIRISILKQKAIFRPIATLAIFSIFIVFGVLAGIVYSQGNPSAPSNLPGSNFTICTGAVELASCFLPSTSPARLNWTYSGAYSQWAFWIQVDNNSNFSSPEVNTGWVYSSNKYYDIPADVLSANTQYYWRMAAADTIGSWSSWTPADASFTTPPYCSDFSLTKTSDIYATIVNKQAAESSKTTIKVTPLYGFNSVVTLSVESVTPSLPSGSSWSFSINPLTEAYYSSGSEFKVNIGSGLTSSQTYIIVIKGTSISPARENTVNVILNAQVRSPDWEEF